MSIGGTSKPGHLSPAAIALIIIGFAFILIVAISNAN